MPAVELVDRLDGAAAGAVVMLCKMLLAWVDVDATVRVKFGELLQDALEGGRCGRDEVMFIEIAPELNSVVAGCAEKAGIDACVWANVGAKKVIIQRNGCVGII